MTGNADDPRLLALAKSISDGTPIDWDRLPVARDSEQKAIIEELKQVEHVASLGGGAPQSWGTFEIIGEIGRGAFGVVYRAMDPTLAREVALKVIGRKPVEHGFDPARAIWEARSLAQIDHQNVVRIFSAERIGDEIGISMELVRGETLAATVERDSPYGAGEAMLIVRDVCRALAAVHSIEKLHGDIKAHNVMREQGGRIVLMDFGTGRDLGAENAFAGHDFAGTPAYLAPEVFAGAARSKASDIYSLGVLLYYLVSGRYPVAGDTRSEVGRRHEQRTAPVPLRDVRSDLPDNLIAVVDCALCLDAKERFSSAGTMEAALTRALTASQPLARTRPIIGLVALLAVLIGMPAIYGGMKWWPSAGHAGASPDVPSTVTVDAAAGYSIGAALLLDENGTETPLGQGARVRPGQKLSLQLQSSVPVYVYVVNEDEQGESYLLFPLPGHTQANPLPVGGNRLPGSRDGERLWWQVTSAGQREHFIIVASPEPSRVFEKLVASIPSPLAGQPVNSHRMPNPILDELRGVGGLSSAPAARDRQLRTDPNFSTPLLTVSEKVRGLWIRTLTLENPAP